MLMVGGGPAPTVTDDEAESFALMAEVLRVNGSLLWEYEAHSSSAGELTPLQEPSLLYHWTLVQLPDTVILFAALALALSGSAWAVPVAPQ